MKLAILLHGGVDRSGENKVTPVFLWLLERLARRHEVHVFAFNQEPTPASWELVGARVRNIGPGKGWRRRLAAAFAAEHRASSFELVHGIFGWGGTYGALLGWWHRVPVLFHPAGGEFVALDDIAYGMRRTARGRLELHIAIAGARRVTVATAYMEELAAALRLVAERVPLGVAVDRWPVCEPRPRQASQPVRLLHVGDIRPVKDHAMLLSAAESLRKAELDFHLDMVGFDTMGGAVQRSPCARSLEPHVRWHGVLGRGALRALMERADILLMSSRHEAGPVVVLEAAVVGVPTVGTHVGHVADWAPHAAVAIPVGDADALARETMALIGDEPRRLSVAREAQRRALAIDADFTAAAFERIYMEMRRS
jgi:glycosyltransferase involved in cell wall biosynthesis